ncbi:unnamed protein product [Rhodiola kirilowii]
MESSDLASLPEEHHNATDSAFSALPPRSTIQLLNTSPHLIALLPPDHV